ncbi:MAG: hypothetical protein ACQKBU_08405 [Verrucomicrobiales bacterium]
MSKNCDSAALLMALRRAGDELPAIEFRADEPLRWDFEPGRKFWRERWQQQGLFGALQSGALSERWLVLDLDDTLLMGSFTTKEQWGALGAAHPGLRSERMRIDWVASARRWMQGKFERVASRKTHPFLNHPPVEVAFRPGILEGLAELQSFGLGFVLVTASARERVDYLDSRFPDFHGLLSGDRTHVIAADEMVPIQLLAAERIASDGLDSMDDPASARAHKIRPRSLAVKTPWAVSQAVGIPRYDLLIDDSATTAEVFHEAGLEKELLFIDAGRPWSGYGVAILDHAIRRILGEESAGAGRLPCPEGLMQIPKDLPRPPSLEDPTYFPLLHYSDQF